MPIDLLQLIQSRRSHIDRLTNQRGAAGEAAVVDAMDAWTARPKGRGLAIVLAALAETGVTIKGSSFDAIALPGTTSIDFFDEEAVRAAVEHMVFIEIKTANQSRVQPGFGGFFFALTEAEILAAESLGSRHRVALYNKATAELLLTSVPEILSRARSSTWQLSVQL